ncbi:ATP-binding protein [Vibrio hannami]|uniref:sensor histidine kinase n=1 Tax=Vibrio hannami TaxID=2717094 RepID=UPI00240FB382|nr:ATP-binding protein [Vibrio hannami]MDG3085846.1 ATP-binding protein [Vibrio hannami]
MINIFRKISVKARLAIIISLSITCILASLIISLIQYSKMSNLVEDIYDHPVTVYHAVSEIALNIELINREMKDIALNKDISEAQKAISHLHRDTLSYFDILKERYLGDKTEIVKLRQLFLDWEPIRKKVFNYRSLNRSDLAYEVTTTEGEVHIQRLSKVVNEIQMFADTKLNQFYEDTKSTSRNGMLIISILALVTIVLFLFFSSALLSSINLQLNKLSRFSKQVAKGDLLADLDTTGNSEIDQLGRDLLSMRESLKELIYKNETQNKHLVESEKLATLGGLVAGVAHEMNTPLGISITATSVIQDIRDELKESFNNQTLTSQQFEELVERLTISSDMLAENLNKGTRLIHDFRLTAIDQVSNTCCSFNIKEILKALLSSMYPETRKVPVVPLLTGNEELMMNSLPGSVTQVLSNLIVNSVQHAFYDQPEPEIEISFEESGKNIILEYRDNGCGIPESLHEKIFEPFYSSSKRTGKNGLGLNLVQTLIRERLNGEMSFTSSLNQGVHFVFTLPKELEQND